MRDEEWRKFSDYACRFEGEFESDLITAIVHEIERHNKSGGVKV